MRVALVVHGFPPQERSGVETHVEALAREFARRGVSTLVFAVRSGGALPHLAVRRELRAGVELTWLGLQSAPRDPAQRLDPPGARAAFAAFLEREQPDLVHFQHFTKLGLGCVEEAQQRGLPTLFTAHDFHAVCHRTALLRPDLARCATLGDAQACARCDAAVAVLDGVAALGDYHCGARPEQLDAPTRARLAAALEQPADDEQRAALDSRRRAVLGALDVVLAPSRFVRARLIEGGLRAEQLEFQPCGIEVERLAALAPVRSAPERLRFGFLGSMTKHKGVHVLLEAWARARLDADLALHGDASDHAHVERLRARARELGVAWHGAYDARDLPRILASLDVLVVPSIWHENAPFVIREAFAARRPVIASRTEALAESVRDGVDGLLFELGDAGALADVLARCTREPGLVASLARRIEAPRTLAQQADELLARYATLLQARSRLSPVDLPASLHGFAARHARLVRTPTRELFGRVLRGLDELRGTLAPEHSQAEFIERALARSRVPSDLADRTAEVAWLRERLAAAEDEARWRAESGAALGAAREAVERERDALRDALAAESARTDAFAKESAWLRGELDGARRELAWRRDTAAALETERETALSAAQDARRAFEGACGERDALAAIKRELEGEVRWLRETLADGAAERAHLRDTLAGLEAERAHLRKSIAGLEAEREHLRASLAALETERSHLRECVQALEAEREQARAALAAGVERLEREAALAHEQQARLERRVEVASAALTALRREHEALERHARWLRAEASALTGASGGAAPRDDRELAQRFAAAREATARTLAELERRRGEMGAALGDGGALFRALLARSALGRRMRSWSGESLT